MTLPIAPASPAGIGGLSALGGVAARTPNTGTGFGDLLSRALGEVSDAQERKADLIGAFLRGEGVELHELMAAAEEASISLELLVEMRNKLTDAYRSVMSMQV